MNDVDELERLVSEIFVNSFKKVSFKERYWYLSPFNVGEVRREVEKEVEKDYRERVPHSDKIMASLDTLSASIKEAGGITRQIYETHHSALNAIARTLTDTNGKISGGHYDLAEDDDRSAEVGNGYKSLMDGEYGEMAEEYSSPNIFGDCGEGTLFQREYNEAGLLTTFRIFHQLHRASLKIATVDLDSLFNRVDELITERNKGRVNVDLDLPYDADTFAYEKMAEFNEAFGKYVTLNAFSMTGYDPKPSLVLEFKDPHLKVAQDFVNLQQEHGVPLTMYRRENLTTLRKEGDFRPLDFESRGRRDRRFPQEKRYDNTPDSVSTYLPVGSEVPEFFPPMLKSYIIQKSSE